MESKQPEACPVCCNGYLVKYTEEYCNNCGTVCASPKTIKDNVDNRKYGRKWVSLTPHEVTALIMEGAAGGGWQGFAQRLSEALKAKNGVKE